MLETRSISKRFGRQTVLDGVDFALRPGEVVGLIGYNGAGKTTFLDVLDQKVRPDSGEVWMDGTRLVPRGLWPTRPAIFRAHQVPRLFDRLSVGDNIGLGRWALPPSPAPAPEIVASHGGLAAGALSVGQRRRVTLDWLQARLGHVRYFLLDEPAAGADDELVAQLQEFVHDARRQERGVLLIEHRDNILRRACDRLVYLCDGNLFDQPPRNGADEVEPVRAVIGTSARRLVGRDLTVARGLAKVIEGVSFTAQAGEVTVVTGPNGCGKSTLLRAVYGDPSCSVLAGELTFEGQNLLPLQLRRRAEAGVHLMPQEATLFQSMTAQDTVRVGVEAVDRAAWSDEAVRELHEEMPVVRRIWRRRCGLLSGGERRLLSLARVLLLRPRVALLDEPLAGIDPAGRERVAELVSRLASRGAAVVIAEQQGLVPALRAGKVLVLQAREPDPVGEQPML